MKPMDLIKRDIGVEGWMRACDSWAESSIVHLDETLSVFTHYKIYRVRGATGQFDFPSLPHGSYGYYAANGREAIRFTRANKDIESILAQEWHHLTQANPVHLASLVLSFYDGGIKATHLVLADEQDLRDMCAPPQRFRLNENALAMALPNLGTTSSSRASTQVVVRAITLLGWMHDKRNLGIETLSIRQDGTVLLDERKVLAKSVFDEVPGIRY